MIIGYEIMEEENDKKKCKRRRNVWVKPWRQKREIIEAYHELVTDFA